MFLEDINPGWGERNLLGCMDGDVYLKSWSFSWQKSFWSSCFPQAGRREHFWPSAEPRLWTWPQSGLVSPSQTTCLSFKSENSAVWRTIRRLGKNDLDPSPNVKKKHTCFLSLYIKYVHMCILDLWTIYFLNYFPNLILSWHSSLFMQCSSPSVLVISYLYSYLFYEVLLRWSAISESVVVACTGSNQLWFWFWVEFMLATRQVLWI